MMFEFSLLALLALSIYLLTTHDAEQVLSMTREW